mmetsp:Transcript_107177/g.268665  ORF Transcript_107177/g.268665 Transcript_107177/m.268665 type:complete len:218 (-) Transcript_107177:547-1200(-)
MMLAKHSGFAILQDRLGAAHPTTLAVALLCPAAMLAVRVSPGAQPPHQQMGHGQAEDALLGNPAPRPGHRPIRRTPARSGFAPCSPLWRDRSYTSPQCQPNRHRHRVCWHPHLGCKQRCSAWLPHALRVHDQLGCYYQVPMVSMAVKPFPLPPRRHCRRCRVIWLMTLCHIHQSLHAEGSRMCNHPCLEPNQQWPYTSCFLHYRILFHMAARSPCHF